MKLKNLHDVLIHQLRDIYFAEKQLVKALPKMVKAANSPELKKAFAGHLEETRGHVTRLEQVFRTLETPAKPQRCPAILGLIEEAGEYAEGEHDPAAQDAGLIASAQRVEHYEIAAYGSVRAFAEQMGHTQAVRLLSATLEEEGNADHNLTNIAEKFVNPAACEGGETGDEAPVANGRSRRRSTVRS